MRNFTVTRPAFLAKISVFIAAIAILFSGCTEEKYHDHDYAAIDIYEYYGNNAIMPREWQIEDGDDGVYYYATRRLPAINDNVIYGGVVLCYFIENNRDNLLPYIRPWKADNYIYSENIRFDIQNGQIRFIVETNNFNSPADIDIPMEFKVVVMQNFVH
ncbi:MAG: hypothetical protein LBR75_05700 [Prevotellaceae bacterium]|jgi:hypothetical protein|nr:hypothetical protein [Prevotellaceae bacterium]